MINVARWLMVSLSLLGASASLARAQETTQQVLRLVPEEFGFVVAGHDLRSQFERWEKSPWLEKIKAAPLAQTFLKSPEWGELLKLKGDLQTHLEIDWPTLRDEVLGDAIVLGYRAGSSDKTGEEGLLLLQARKGDLLVKLIERLNVLQKKSGELKELEEKEHRGIKYYRRAHDKSTQYYFVRNGLLALCGQEATMTDLIGKLQEPAGGKANSWTRSLERASAPKSFLTLIVNPRAFDNEFKSTGAKTPADYFHAKFKEYWDALDSIVVNARWDESVEVRLALLGKSKDPSAAARRLFRPVLPNPLWAHFPDKGILTLTGQIDLTLSEDSWGEVLPPAFRTQVMDGMRKSIGALIGIDLEKDLLPHIGPDWGVSVFASDNPKYVPQALFAIAARSGPKDPAADQALFKGLQFLAGLAVFDYNRRHSDHILIQTVRQGKIEVKTLVNEKGFPSGFQPSFALKEGYLLFASSPEGILRFTRHVDATSPKEENLILRLSASELSKQMTLRRDFLVEHVAKSNGIPRSSAEGIFDGVGGLLGLFDRVELGHTATREQMTLILRISP